MKKTSLVLVTCSVTKTGRSEVAGKATNQRLEPKPEAGVEAVLHAHIGIEVPFRVEVELGILTEVDVRTDSRHVPCVAQIVVVPVIVRKNSLVLRAVRRFFRFFRLGHRFRFLSRFIQSGNHNVHLVHHKISDLHHFLHHRLP